MDLHELRRHWDQFGRQDPLWAILTDPARKGGRWTVEEFFATGVAELDALMAEARTFGLPLQRRCALDFGCGVGRLTQALAAHADQVIGLDVAPSMIAHARTFNRHPDRVRYEVQAAPPLAAVASGSVDLVVTGRVLQHIPPQYSRLYVRELARVLAPGGFLSFDLPSRTVEPPALPIGALAPTAYRAALVATRRPSDAASVVVDVVVTNTSEVPWPADAAINVGNHWRAGDGTTIVVDDCRVAVPLPLAPGQSATVTLAMRRPDAPAATVLELDVVHEGITWFAWAGSPTTTLDLQPARSLAASADPDPGAEPRFEPMMEMHAVPREDIVALLAEAGVRLLQVRTELHCGPSWEAFRYDVTAAPAGARR